MKITLSALHLVRHDIGVGRVAMVCVARMQGEGTVCGSVAGGGVRREIVITELIPPDAKAPATAGTKK